MREITQFEINLIKCLKNRHYSASVHIRDLEEFNKNAGISPEQKEYNDIDKIRYQFLVDEIQKIFDDASKP